VSLLNDLVSTIDGDAPVRDVRVGVFWTAVVSRGCGLASTTREGNYQHGDTLVREAGSLVGRNARSVVSLASRAHSLLEATIGIAALNSLLPVDEGRCLELNAADLLEERGRGKRVAMVGHFPFVPRLRQAATQLWVLELKPRGEDVAAEEAKNVIPQGDVVAITGSALINGTLEYLLGLCTPQSFVVVLGPTTPLSPVLFDHGVDVVSGTKVVDAELVLRCAAQGAAFRQMRGVRLLTMMRQSST
jgi:uncharacterized protein (DUF4213/DUF364 family)